MQSQPVRIIHALLSLADDGLPAAGGVLGKERFTHSPFVSGGRRRSGGGTGEGGGRGVRVEGGGHPLRCPATPLRGPTLRRVHVCERLSNPPSLNRRLRRVLFSYRRFTPFLDGRSFELNRSTLSLLSRRESRNRCEPLLSSKRTMSPPLWWTVTSPANIVLSFLTTN